MICIIINIVIALTYSLAESCIIMLPLDGNEGIEITETEPNFFSETFVVVILKFELKQHEMLKIKMSNLPFLRAFRGGSSMAKHFPCLYDEPAAREYTIHKHYELQFYSTLC